MVRIIHRLSDGRIVESMDGFVVPYNDQTKRAYEILYESALEQARKAEKDKATAATVTQ